MSNFSPKNTYHQNRIKTAGQSELIVMLYDAAIRNLQTALGELETEKPRIDIVNNAQRLQQSFRHHCRIERFTEFRAGRRNRRSFVQPLLFFRKRNYESQYS